MEGGWREGNKGGRKRAEEGGRVKRGSNRARERSKGGMRVEGSKGGRETSREIHRGGHSLRCRYYK